MNAPQLDLKAPVVEAAGGILWRTGPTGREIAIIYRAHYNDWTLPKGKREPGETWQETALREVFEETGCQAQLESFAGATAYAFQAIPKVVLFWNMTILNARSFFPNKEVDALEWLLPDLAKEKLSYEAERNLIP